MQATFETLRDIIVRDYELASERLQPDTPLADIDLDSLAVIELVFSLEDEFKVTAEDTAGGFETLGDIANYIDQLIAERDTGKAGATASGTASRE